MLRTSASQFEVMVAFMEEHGDITKPSDGPHGRLQAINRWEELTGILNLDATGNYKPVEKWKKVWSDYKNNTKRKAAKINRAVHGTGGGPACSLTLSSLEQRVISLMGTQAATGLVGIPEVGLEIAGPSIATVDVSSEEAPFSVESPNYNIFDLEDGLDMLTGTTRTLATPDPVESVVAQATSPPSYHAQGPRGSATSARRPQRVPRERRRQREYNTTRRAGTSVVRI